MLSEGFLLKTTREFILIKIRLNICRAIFIYLFQSTLYVHSFFNSTRYLILVKFILSLNLFLKMTLVFIAKDQHIVSHLSIIR